MCVLSHRIAWMLTTVFVVDLLIISSRTHLQPPCAVVVSRGGREKEQQGCLHPLDTCPLPLVPAVLTPPPHCPDVCVLSAVHSRDRQWCRPACSAPPSVHPFPVGREGQSALHDEADDAVDTEGDDGGGGRTAKEDSVEEDIASHKSQWTRKDRTRHASL